MNGHHISARHRENGDCCIRGKEEDSFQKGRGQKNKNKKGENCHSRYPGLQPKPSVDKCYLGKE